MVLSFGWTVLIWKYRDKLSHDREFLTRKTNGESKERSTLAKKESPNSPRARKTKTVVNS